MNDKCLMCGRCCELYIACTPKDQLRLYKMRLGYVETVKYKKQFYTVYRWPCKYLQDNKCLIYFSDRPRICSRFPERDFLGLWCNIMPGCGFCVSQKKEGVQ